MSEFKKRTFGAKRYPSSGARSGPRDFGAPQERHQATCNKCGNTCEVPFRPNGKKPVYCRDCFVKDDDRGASAYPKRDYGADRPAFRPQASPDRGTEALSRQMTALEKKFDALSARIEKLMIATPASEGASLDTLIQSATAPKKKRKAAKK